ncbi:galactose-binding domain-like protein [Kalaharituber pfeilii]|nr:galactose-binding domain-like protein [Kalaharituber pfeilii]
MSHSCHSEHTHSHGGGGDGGDDHHHHHTHDHTEDLTPTTHTTLYPHISHSHITTLNESVPGSGAAVVEKPYTERLSPHPFLLSGDDDPELLMHVPFTAQVKLHSILIRAGSTGAGAAPKTIKLYVNRPEMDFSSVGDVQETQKVVVPRPGDVAGAIGAEEGVVEVPVKRGLFMGGRDSDEEESDEGEGVPTEISYLGFKGDWLRTGGAPIGVLYEAAANPKDHKVTGKVGERAGWELGGGGGGQGGY